MTIPSWQISRPLCSIKTCPLVASIAFQASFSVLFYILASLPFTCPLKVPTKSSQSPLKVPRSPSKSLEKAASSSLKCPYTKSAAVIRKAPLINSQLEEAPIFKTVSVILDMASADESNCKIYSSGPTVLKNCMFAVQWVASRIVIDRRLPCFTGHPTMHHYVGCTTLKDAPLS